MRGENKNPIRSHFEVMKRLARYIYKSDSDRRLLKLAVRLRPLHKMSATDIGLSRSAVNPSYGRSSKGSPLISKRSRRRSRIRAAKLRPSSCSGPNLSSSSRRSRLMIAFIVTVSPPDGTANPEGHWCPSGNCGRLLEGRWGCAANLRAGGDGQRAGKTGQYGQHGIRFRKTGQVGVTGAHHGVDLEPPRIRENRNPGPIVTRTRSGGDYAGGIGLARRRFGSCLWCPDLCVNSAAETS
jgi:hypothetical protein